MPFSIFQKRYSFASHQYLLSTLISVNFHHSNYQIINMLNIIDGQSNENTVVFLHGFLLSSKQWTKLALHRAPWRSVLIDLPYHGIHKHVELKARNLEAYAEFVISELQTADIQNYTLVGHSMGGYIGLLMLEKDPRMKQLVLLHSNIWEDSAERKKNRERVAQIVKKNKRLFLRESIPLLFKNRMKHNQSILTLISEAEEIQAEGIIHGALSMRDRKESHEIVRKNKDRCYFIQGSHDALISFEDAKLVWGQVGKINNFFKVPDCGHMSHFERPRVLRIVLETII